MWVSRGAGEEGLEVGRVRPEKASFCVSVCMSSIKESYLIENKVYEKGSDVCHRLRNLVEKRDVCVGWVVGWFGGSARLARIVISITIVICSTIPNLSSRNLPSG